MSLLVFALFLGPFEVKDIEAFEKSLLKAETVQFSYEITSTGQVVSKLSGFAGFAPNNKLTVAAEGSFMDADKNFKLQSDGKHMHSPKGAMHTPEDLVDAMLVGFCRMGLLHNLAVMSMGGNPDGTFGAARKNYLIFSDGDARMESVEGKEAIGLPFRLEVGGKTAARGVLWLDRKSGLPFLRKQVVHFADGDMHVEERYTDFVLDVPLKHEIPRLGH